nr:putative ribonuclease H-like domain-containing protein [Tanacetum cinerariifolium]
MIRVAIGRKSKALLSHLTSDPPKQSSETYEQWEQEDLIVFSWLIQKIEHTLAGNLTKYHTAKTLWDALVITYNNERDKLQTFNIHVKANDIKQNKTHMKCGNCGMTRQTTEQCFELISYPDWWTDGHKNQGPERGKASAANIDTDQKSPTGFEGMATTTINEEDGSFSMTQWSGGRECIDTLSWLKYVTYEEGRNNSIQPEDPNVSVAQEAPNLIPEVSNTHSSPISKPVETTNNTSGHGESVQEQEIFATQKDTPVEQNEHMEEQENFPTQENTSERYTLPPRANQGVPPKRYSPEKMSRGSRYPIANIAKGNPSEEAKDFALSMYSDEILANMEQALKLKHWKDAMEEEIKALTKNNTWEKRVLPPGKKTVGSPHGFTNSFGEREVCLLQKSLYGLKQSSRAWCGRFTLSMKHYGFRQSNSDHTLFLKQRCNLTTCLIICVDDMIITRNDKEEIIKLKKNLFTKFEMKDLGRLKYFLGIEVLRSKQGIFLYQKKYVLDLLAEIDMVDCKPADTPMTAHMKAVLRIIRYLKGTAGHGVLFKQNGHLETQLYTDADWAEDKGYRRSTSGYFTLVGGNLVTWRSKKQKVVALSSAEAEF